MNESVSLIVIKIEELIRVCAGQVQAFYPIVLRQQIIQAIIPMVILPIALFLTPLLIKFSKKVDWENDNVYCPLVILFGVILTVGIIYGTIGTLMGIGMLLNPNYYAVQDLFNIGSRLITK